MKNNTFNKEKILLFLPIYNEERRIQDFLNKLKESQVEKIVDKILIVNDGSTDNSVELILRNNIDAEIINHGCRSGLGEAFRAAYKYALKNNFTIFCTLSTNGKDDPADIKNILKPILDEEADYIQGSRFIRGGISKKLPIQRFVAIKFFTLLFNFINKTKLTDASNGFRAYKMDLLKNPRVKLNQKWLGCSYETEIYLLCKAAQLKYPIKEVSVSKIYPEAGSYSKARIKDWFSLIKPIIYLALKLKQ